MKQRLKINGWIMFVAFLAVLAFSSVLFRRATINPVDQIVKVFGYLLILLGQVFRISARGFKAEHSGQGNRLIQQGPYGFVRNPMYLGILLIGIGVVTVLFQWWVALVFTAVFMLRYITLTQSEEKKLSALFGKEYAAYCSRVPRIFPSLQSLATKEAAGILPMKTAWVGKEIGSAATLLAATLLVEAWQDGVHLGLALYFPEALARVPVVALFIVWVILLCRQTGKRNDYVSGQGAVA